MSGTNTLFASSLLFIAACASAEPTCRITNYGILEEGELVAITDESGTASGKVRHYKPANIREKTDRIPAKLGLRFGVKHEFQGIPPNSGLQASVIHPAMRSSTGELRTLSKGPKNPMDVGTNYGFDREAELLPGQWVFQFHYKGQLLCEKAFTVYAD